MKDMATIKKFPYGEQDSAKDYASLDSITYCEISMGKLYGCSGATSTPMDLPLYYTICFISVT